MDTAIDVAVVTLYCAIVGVAGSVFSVTIDPEKTVLALKKEIKESGARYLKNVMEDDLQLFVAKADCGRRWLEENEASDGWSDTRGMKQLRVDRAQLRTKAVGLPRGQLGEDVDAETVAGGGGPIHVLVGVRVGVDVVAERTMTGRKRTLDELQSEFPAPSSFAHHSGKHGWQTILTKHKDQIICHRLTTAINKPSLPIVLLHRSFATFERNCAEIRLDGRDCDFVASFCVAMSDTEASLVNTARKKLEQYLFDGWASGATIVPVQVDNSMSDGSYLYGKSLLLNLEVKIHKSAREGDPTMQNIGHYIKHLPSRIDRSMPCYLLDISGPLLSVFGIVNVGDEAVVCEPLVASLPLLYFDTPLLTSLARVCASLKVAMRELTRELEDGNKQVVTSDVSRFTFPYKDTALVDGKEVKLTYEAPLVCYVFRAQLSPSQTKVIVKFARQYGLDVHQYCADEGVAPKLLSHEVLVNNWAFVVMESLELVPLARAPVVSVLSQLKMIKEKLVAADFVHGDLRECNVLWDATNTRVVLIDFDWSGKNTEAIYPPFMNSELSWPPGAETGKPLLIEHDNYWIDLLLAELGGAMIGE